MLSPYRVLDLTDNGALLAGQILGDLGADVIVIEPPGGAEARHHGPYHHDTPDTDRSLNWWALNRNKRSVTLDIESEAGRARIRELVATADFLLESLAPGYLASLGLGYDALARINPRLVMVSITPFGQQGPKAGWAASDLTCMASSGVLLMTGDDDRAPVAVSVPQAYLHAAGEAAAGALIAHIGRERDGRGQHVDVSVQAATIMATQATVLSSAWGDKPTGRMAGGVNFGGIPLKFVNPAKDGHVSVTFLFGSAIGPFSRRLMELMYEEGVVDAATRDKDWLNYTTLLVTGQEPISELMRCIDAIGRFTSRYTRAELLDMAMRRSLLIVPVNSTADVVNSEQLAARDFWTGVEHDELGERVTYPGPFAKFGAKPITYRRRPPRLGEHTEEVAREQRPAAAVAPSNSATPRSLPLAGIKVVDFMWVIAGPWGVRYLADYGATVVHVESPTRIDTARTVSPFKDGVPGPARSGAFANINAGKLGLTLNLANPKAREIALRLARWADVVTESFAPGAMKKLGLDYDSLRVTNPGLIMISSCLNGQNGPQANLAGYGTMGAQIAGFGLLAGWPDRPPAGPAGAYTDYIAPKFTAAAILAALDHRRRTGDGQYIDFAQGEAAAQFLAPALLDCTVNGRAWERAGNASPDYAPHGAYPVAGSDRWVAIVATNDDQWRSLCTVTGHRDWLADPRFATLEARLANRDALDTAIADWTVGRSVDDVERLLQSVGVPAHRLSSSEDLIADPQLVHRRHFLTVPHPELGPVVIENSRMVFSATPANVTAPGPSFGQHNDEILRDILGLDGEAIIELVASGALD
jgi:crotonobetainyl-CoA:carnitine CoA-transferase CaiB-like acyl-CoA transferase